MFPTMGSDGSAAKRRAERDHRTIQVYLPRVGSAVTTAK
jgi:hypothetical protein